MDPVVQPLILIVTGIVAGTVSGAFGVGGGSIMTPVQFWLYTAGGMASTPATRLAFGTSLAVIIPTMVSGTIGHHRHGVVDWKAAIPMGIAAVAGGFAGGIAASHIPGALLRMFFALFLLVMAIRMVWHISGSTESESRGSTPVFLITGFFIGILSGLTGLGGGALLVPILVILLGYPIHRAVGTSSACIIFSAAGAVVAYIVSGLDASGLPPFSIGYVDLPTFAILAVTTIPLAWLGVRFAHHCSGKTLQVLFAFLLVLISGAMLITG